MLKMLAFDADDTLWQNETLYVLTESKFAALLEPYRSHTWTGRELFETEMRNLRMFGYGVKGFTLSMIETAIELTDGRVTGREIQQIIDFARHQLDTPIELLPHVADVIPQLAQRFPLMLITKGDLFDQESKLARSGLADHFTAVEIVSDKTSEVYQRILTKYSLAPSEFLMVGNSPRSDILPVVQIGAHAVYLPFHLTWAHEHAAIHEHDGYIELEHIGLLPDLLERFTASAA
jgi:putative hydrolase of the HAD superfamily